jgi:hypothetical protein
MALCAANKIGSSTFTSGFSLLAILFLRSTVQGELSVANIYI